MMDWNSKRTRPGGSGIVRARQFLPMSRRRFLGMSAAAAGVGLAGGLSPRRALSATEVAYMGWLGYDEAANVGGFLDQNDAVLQATYMESAEQWQSAIQGGGRGNMDLGTPVSFHIPHAARQGWLEPLDTSKIPNLQQTFPEFQGVAGPQPRRAGLCRALHLGLAAVDVQRRRHPRSRRTRGGSCSTPNTRAR